VADALESAFLAIRALQYLVKPGISPIATRWEYSEQYRRVDGFDAHDFADRPIHMVFSVEIGNPRAIRGYELLSVLFGRSVSLSGAAHSQQKNGPKFG
jgi:hypothetical protein